MVGFDMLHRIFLRHPHSVGETYGEHFLHASSFALDMLFGAFACFFHALIPGLFERTASGVISKLNVRMVTHRRANARLSSPEAAAIGPASNDFAYEI
jgi:hypothetical protein